MDNFVFCTYFDKSYLPKGLALYTSLIKFHPNSKLWILCMDDYTLDILTKMKLKNAKLVPLAEFEDKELLKAKNNRNWVEYYWTCTPSLPLYIFRHDFKTRYVVYLDADLYLFGKIDPVFAELNGGSIYIVESRYPLGQEYRISLIGRFNVGFQIFAGNKEGMACLRKWRKQCLDWCYWKYEDNKLGDQMYLNEWPSLYKQLVISKNLGVNAAPWNIGQYSVTEKDKTVYIERDRLICYHFHQFLLLSENKFDYSAGYRLTSNVRKLIYSPYITATKEAILTIRNIDSAYKVKNHYGNLLMRFKNKLAKNIGPVYWKIQTILSRRVIPRSSDRGMSDQFRTKSEREKTPRPSGRG